MYNDKVRRLVPLVLLLIAMGFAFACASARYCTLPLPLEPPSAPESSFTPKQWQLSDDLRVTELSPGIWLHTSWRVLRSGQRFLSNGLLVREDERLVLVDTAWGVELTEQLLDWVDDTLGLEVDRAVVTHFHADRMGGSPVLAERGIPFMGLELTRELGKDDGIPLPVPLVGLALDKAVTFGALEVFYPGPGHSRDNLVVWVPEAKLLFGGCAVRPGNASTAGNTADADVDAWPEAIRRLIARYGDAETVVPSHGPPGTADLLAHTLKILETR